MKSPQRKDVVYFSTFAAPTAATDIQGGRRGGGEAASGAAAQRGRRARTAYVPPRAGVAHAAGTPSPRRGPPRVQLVNPFLFHHLVVAGRTERSALKESAGALANAFGLP